MKFTSTALLLSLLHQFPLLSAQQLGGELLPPRPPPAPTGFGDPHFRTYDGTTYSFHGQCDLVMARSVSFDDGLGLELHARTEIVTDWSLIKSAALRIGNDTFELSNDGSYYFNGLKNANLNESKLADKYAILQEEVVHDVKTNNGVKHERKLFVTVDLGDKKSIKLTLWKHMISIQVNIHLYDTEGMLGIYDHKGMIGRDRETTVADVNEMGLQWQVQDTEPRLFHEIQLPQFPDACALPSVDTRQRRLKEVTMDFLQDAQEACANVEPDLKQFCIDDVVLTRDIHTAKAYGDSEGFSF